MTDLSGRPVNIDADPRNADWTKQTLDLIIPDGRGSIKMVANVDDMREYLRLHGRSVEEFKRLPVYTLALRKQPWLRDL